MLVLVASGWACLVIAIAVAPARVREVCAKEGACELVSHVVLAVAMLAFAAAAVRARGHTKPRPGALALVAVLAGIVLGEELDWGGLGNVHNAAGGHSYALFALAAPVLAAVALGRGSWAVAWRERLGPWAPTRGDGAAALVVAAVALASALVPWPWESEVDEVAELLGYAVLTGVALRGHASASGLSSSTQS
ncbi:MAG TPA: hypothetical protein VFG69_17095 [Nannocystaceae bacterium]|nr:hypothetical protein [Nannocystaceae bacterium]